MRKACRRKKVDPNSGLAAAIFGAGLLSPKQLADLRLKELTALESLTMGRATEWDLREVESMISISSEMACSGIGPEAQVACIVAADYLSADLARMRETGAVSTTPEALQTYRDVFEYMDLQRQSVSSTELARHVQKVINRIQFTKPKEAP